MATPQTTRTFVSAPIQTMMTHRKYVWKTPVVYAFPVPYVLPAMRKSPVPNRKISYISTIEI